LLYWQIGKLLKEYVVQTERAPYDQEVMKGLAAKLQKNTGRDGATSNFDIVSALRRLSLKIRLSPHCGDN
jgi:hypothetical protein